MSSTAPPLDTERLTLRGHQLADFSDSFAMWSDPVVVRHISGKPSTREEAWSRVLRHAGHWALLGFGYWVIRERASGRFVGEIGFADFHRDLQPSFDDVPEAGWALATWSHGRGFATEALGAALAWADEDPRFARTACLIAPENAASIRVADKCGYRQVGSVVYHDEPSLVLERRAQPSRLP
jgi:RimJ/RimL family protein N-acetyltransferase